MLARHYKLTVLGSALSWFLVGLHFPVLHQMTHHGRTPHWSVLTVVSLLAVAAVVGLWTLLRAPAREAA